ncbi:MAG: 7-cyano-7-deazaguanine synthase QueC [bacterium]
MKNRKKRAVVLLSGGLDSATALYWAKSKGYKIYALIFSYGQKHGKEVKKAVKIAEKAKVPFTILKIRIPWGGSSLIDKNEEIPQTGNARLLPKGGQAITKKRSNPVPSTYVPGRNTIFISFALSFCEAEKLSSVFIGANAVDYSGYPDCRPGYIAAFDRLLKEASLGKIKLKAPLLSLSKKEIVLLAFRLKVPVGLTWSCYKGGRYPCGKCDSCLLRAKGFREAGIKDPTKN